MLPTCETALYVSRIGFHAIIVAFFFAIWLGPGERRLSWLFWSLAFTIELGQAMLMYLGQWTVPFLWVLGAAWLISVVTACSLWNRGEYPSWRVLSLAIVLFMSGYARYSANWSVSLEWVYMVAMITFFMALYGKVGGPILAVIGTWAAIGESFAALAIGNGHVLDAPTAMPLAAMSAEFAQLILGLALAYLFLSRIQKERKAYEQKLEQANLLRSLAIQVKANGGEPINIPTTRQERQDVIGVKMEQQIR